MKSIPFIFSLIWELILSTYVDRLSREVAPWPAFIDLGGLLVNPWAIAAFDLDNRVIYSTGGEGIHLNDAQTRSLSLLLRTGFSGPLPVDGASSNVADG